jgi:hypothetical protein
MGSSSRGRARDYEDSDGDKDGSGRSSEDDDDEDEESLSSDDSDVQVIKQPLLPGWLTSWEKLKEAVSMLRDSPSMQRPVATATAVWVRLTPYLQMAVRGSFSMAQVFGSAALVHAQWALELTGNQAAVYGAAAWERLNDALQRYIENSVDGAGNTTNSNNNNSSGNNRRQITTMNTTDEQTRHFISGDSQQETKQQQKLNGIATISPTSVNGMNTDSTLSVSASLELGAVGDQDEDDQNVEITNPGNLLNNNLNAAAAVPLPETPREMRDA